MITIDKVIEVDNFFQTPDSIRKAALECRYWRSEEHPAGGCWPGQRSDYVSVISGELFETFCQSLYKSMGWSRDRSVFFETFFQICTTADGDSWVHQDIQTQNWTHVGLVYLSPDAPMNGGTLIYKPKDDRTVEDLKKENHGEAPSDERHYDMIHEVTNVYNKCITYNPETLHKSNKYFGDSITNGRLTQIYFARDNEA